MDQIDKKQEGTSKRLSPNFLRRFKSKQRNSAEKRTSLSLAAADTSTAERQSPDNIPLPSEPAVDNSTQQREVISEAQTDTTDTNSENHGTAQPSVDKSHSSLNDAERTKARYEKAAKKLQKSLELGRGNWEGFTFVDNHDVSQTISQMREELEIAMNSWKVSAENRGLWSKAKPTTAQVFTATSPFLKNFLTVAKSADSITVLNPYGLIAGGLMLFVADREIGRREMVEKTVDYICRQLSRLKVIEGLPDAKIESETLINRATDVLSGALTYLAVYISREPGVFGVLGNIVKTIATGAQECEDVDRELRNAVTEFNFELATFAHQVGFRTYEVGIQTLERVDEVVVMLDGVRQDLSLFQPEQTNTTNAALALEAEEKFIVPYERNPHFKGRAELLKALYDKLCQSLPDQYNHRVALYGLGGVGKTQLALEYVYQHYRDSQTYDRVYWVSADSQASFFTALQEIGVRTHCLLENKDLKPPEIAARVIRWLNKQENLLFVLDNLDDISVAEEYLLEMAPCRHMLITTRNEHCDDIPAEGLQVPVLDTSEAVELLLRRCKVGAVGEKTEAEIEAAQEIVMELGCLPLGIDQAAAYIREASHDIFQFLPSYRQNRKFHHNRTSKRNRMYSKSLATTWSLSFQKVQENNEGAAHLLKLLAFLNPDGVLIEFLEAGKEGLTGQLHEIVADRTRLYNALAELTRFSLVGRHDEVAPRITMHRLVQSIIQNDLPSSEFNSIVETVIGLCESAFPRSESNGRYTVELRQLGRAYLEQVIVAFRVVRRSSSARAGTLLWYVGIFLLDDGNYSLAEEVLTKALEIATSLNGVEDLDTLLLVNQLGLAHWYQRKLDDAQRLQVRGVEGLEILLGKEDTRTLRAMGNLALTYRYQGKLEDAQRLQETVFEVMENELGKEDPATLRAMGNLALTYYHQGKLEDAQRLQETVFERMENELGKEDPAILRAMGNLALTYYLQGKLEDAQRLQETVFGLRQKLLGQSHPETSMAMTDLAITYRDRGMLPRSLELLEDAADKQTGILGPNYTTTLFTYSQLAISYAQDGRLDDAITLLESTLESQKRIMGENHPESKQTAAALDSVYQRQREMADKEKDGPKVISSLPRPDDVGESTG